MLRRILVPLAAASLLAASLALAQDAPAPLKGYLGGDTPDGVRLLAPPPAAGSGREADDQAIFNATRALKGDPRWSLAQSNDVRTWTDDYSSLLPILRLTQH